MVQRTRRHYRTRGGAITRSQARQRQTARNQLTQFKSQVNSAKTRRNANLLEEEGIPKQILNIMLGDEEGLDQMPEDIRDLVAKAKAEWDFKDPHFVDTVMDLIVLTRNMIV